jgi:anti-sigma factor RsiW
MNAADLHVLTGAYAGGALCGDEQDHFVEHLTRCPSCAVEVQELLETTALLGVAVACPAPAGLRRAVFAEAARTRQLPPVVTPPFGP